MATPPSAPPKGAPPAAQPQAHAKPHFEEEHDEAHAEEGEGSWLVSYADMMTLLMSFFALMFSFSKIDQKKFDDVREEVSQKFGGKMKLPFDDLNKELQKITADMKLIDEVTIKQDGNGISIVFAGSVIFSEGSTELAGRQLEIVKQIVEAISQKANGFPIVVEGHTDDVPIKKPGIPSNWELSAMRASSVVRMFTEKKYPAQFLTAEGFADGRPLVPNRDASGKDIPENRAKNRRVVMRISRG